jgi:rare lipoprotein A
MEVSFVNIGRVAICVLYVVIPSLLNVAGQARDLLFVTPRTLQPCPFSKLSAFSKLSPFPKLSTVSPISSPAQSSAQSPDSDEQPEARAHPNKHPVEHGYAAFYSQSLEGHKTACGGVYYSTELTAAHRTFPCGAKLRVTNLRNGKSVRVTVNDHGPTSHDRVIDLSYAAAQALDFIHQGTTLVKVEFLR